MFHPYLPTKSQSLPKLKPVGSDLPSSWLLLQMVASKNLILIRNINWSVSQEQHSWCILKFKKIHERTWNLKVKCSRLCGKRVLIGKRLQILTIVMPGSTKLARFSSTDTLSGGILVLSPGSWLVLFIEEALLSEGEAAVSQNRAFSIITLIFLQNNWKGVSLDNAYICRRSLMFLLARWKRSKLLWGCKGE